MDRRDRADRTLKNETDFAAWEQPQLFTEELRGAFRSLR